MPSTIYLVTGGARSGKSSYAQRLCESLSDSPIYLATSKTWDDEFADRIARHQADRGDKWTTIEEPLYPSKHVENFHGKIILVDCLTLWLTNFMVETGALSMPKEGQDATSDLEKKDAPERALEACKEEFLKLTEPWDATFCFVTNEIGSGTHSDNSMTRSFVDVQGWLNQFVADKAEWVIHMVCGQANTIKEPAGSDSRDPLILPSKHAVNEAARLDKFLSARKLPMDPKGYFMISVDRSESGIVVKFYSCIVNDKGEVCDLEGNKIPCHGTNRAEPMKVWKGRTAKEITMKIFEQWEHAPNVVTVGHAAYIGREVQRAEHCLYSGNFYQQD
jgi:adenosylcobinamide kinase/adenosylcobinamide-phosphate guanylyltransferase